MRSMGKKTSLLQQGDAMNMINTLDVNKKLAAWVGRQPRSVARLHGRIPLLIDDDNTVFTARFTESLEQCNEWLFPKVKASGYLLTLKLIPSQGWKAQLTSDKDDVILGVIVGKVQSEATSDSLALALSMAIYDLILKLETEAESGK